MNKKSGEQSNGGWRVMAKINGSEKRRRYALLRAS
jgi:hypothetical protein